MIEDEGVGGIRAELPDDEDVAGSPGSKEEGESGHFDIPEQEAGDQREDAEDDERGEGANGILPFLQRLVAMAVGHTFFPFEPETDALPAVLDIVGEDKAVDELVGKQTRNENRYKDQGGKLRMVRDIEDAEIADVSQGPAVLEIPYWGYECKEHNEDDDC